MKEMGQEKEGAQTPLTTEIYNPLKRPWSEIRDEIMGLEQAISGEDGFQEDVMQVGFENPANIIILAKNEKREIIGYTWACPADILYTEEEPDYEPFQGRKADANTVYVYNTGFIPDERGKGYVAQLYKALDIALLARTDRTYTKIHRDAAIANGLDQKILKNYPGSIDNGTHPSPYGPQRFIEMPIIPSSDPVK